MTKKFTIFFKNSGKIILIILIFALIIFLIYRKILNFIEKKDDFTNDGKLTIVFYNVENLYSPKDNYGGGDDEFTPDGKKHWTWKRYHKKLNHIAQIINLIGNGSFPDVIGLSEVENKEVLEALADSTILKKADYKIIHTESNDPRGIDIALLYKPSEFKVKKFETIDIFLEGKKLKTRPILKVEGKYENEKVYIYVNHWKSRRGGVKETQDKRMASAQTLYMDILKILEKNSKAKIIIIGDFNDDCNDYSISEILEAKQTKNLSDYRFLYNAMTNECKNGKTGTEWYKGWHIFDQIIVSKSLTDTTGLHLEGDAKIFRGDSVLIRKNKKLYINRCYYNGEYKGGVSDHLPVYAIFKK